MNLFHRSQLFTSKMNLRFMEISFEEISFRKNRLIFGLQKQSCDVEIKKDLFFQGVHLCAILVAVTTD